MKTREKNREKILKEIARDKWITQKELAERKDGIGRLKMENKELADSLGLTQKGIEWNLKSRDKISNKFERWIKDLKEKGLIKYYGSKKKGGYFKV